MLYMKRSYEMDDAVVQAIDRWTDSMGLVKNPTAQLAFWVLMCLDASDRDRYLKTMKTWIAAGGPITEHGEIPPEFRSALDADLAAFEVGPDTDFSELIASLPEGIRDRWKKRLTKLALALTAEPPAGKQPGGKVQRPTG